MKFLLISESISHANLVNRNSIAQQKRPWTLWHNLFRMRSIPHFLELQSSDFFILLVFQKLTLHCETLLPFSFLVFDSLPAFKYLRGLLNTNTHPPTYLTLKLLIVAIIIMCCRRRVHNFYTVCGHTHILPEELVECDSRWCKFSRNHSPNCTDCKNTCWQYRQYPQHYTPHINGKCQECLRAEAKARHPY